MRYFKHQFVTVDRTLELYFSGCSIHCKNCQNEFLWNADFGKDVNPEYIINEIKPYVSIAKQIHILGGEPFEQPLDEMKELLKKIKECGFKNIVFFTGMDYDSVIERKDYIVYADYVKYGKYDEEQLEEKISEYGLFKLASKNQKVMKINKVWC